MDSIFNLQSDSNNDVVRFLNLPEHIQVKILGYCDFKTLLKASQTCKKFEDLMFDPLVAASDLNKRVTLRIIPNIDLMKIINIEDTVDIVEITGNGRVYSKIRVGLSRDNYIGDEASTWESYLISFFKTSGQWVKQLSFNGIRGRDVSIVELLSLCPKVNSVKASAFKEEPLPMENIQDLKLDNLTKLDLNGTVLEILDAFGNVRSLQHLKVDSIDNGNLQQLDDFIINQEDLNHLTINAIRHQTFFKLHRLNDINFKLESFATNNLTIDPSSAAKFFADQRFLKEVKLSNFYRQESFNHRLVYSRIIATVFTLPHLMSLELGADTISTEDFPAMANIKNETLKRLRFDGDKLMYEKLIAIFPNLSDVRVRTDKNIIDLETISAEHLAILDAHRLRALKFQSESPPTDQKKFENQLLEFFARHIDIKHLVIGHSSWKESNFRLSLRFWSKACQILQSLRSIVIFDLPEIKELISRVSGHESLQVIKLLADEESRQIYDEMKADDNFAYLLQ